MELLKLYDQTTPFYCYTYLSLPPKYHNREFNKFFNFMLKHMDVEDHIFYTNSIIRKIWEQWNRIIKTKSANNGNEILNHRNDLIFHFYTVRDFVSNLRKIVDDCLTLYSIATNKYKKNGNPIESIGDYLNQEDRFKDFLINKDFLLMLNDLSNACKHSFGAEPKIGKDEPCIFVYETKEDKSGQFNYNIRELGFSIDNLVVKFNDFYYHFDQILKDYAK